MEDAARFFDTLRAIRGQTYRALFAELWVGAWHSLQQYATEAESSKTISIKSFLFVKAILYALLRLTNVDPSHFGGVKWTLRG